MESISKDYYSVLKKNRLLQYALLTSGKGLMSRNVSIVFNDVLKSCLQTREETSSTDESLMCATRKRALL